MLKELYTRARTQSHTRTEPGVSQQLFLKIFNSLPCQSLLFCVMCVNDLECLPVFTERGCALTDLQNKQGKSYILSSLCVSYHTTSLFSCCNVGCDRPRGCGRTPQHANRHDVRGQLAEDKSYLESYEHVMAVHKADWLSTWVLFALLGQLRHAKEKGGAH